MKGFAEKDYNNKKKRSPNPYPTDWKASLLLDYRICPFPAMRYLILVSSTSPMGPRA